MKTRLYKYGVALSVAVAGAIVGLGAFTFRFADGLSYFSTDPRACANCHIMNDQFASWAQGPHHLRGVGCVDCHLPHALVPKLIAKASNGYHHSKGFTLQDFHEPILIKPRNAEILQANCVRCHGDFVRDALLQPRFGGHGGTDAESAVTPCVHCHRNAGHGARN